MPFKCHGVRFHGKTGDKVIGNCPFCGKEKHFYADVNSGLWDCKVCGEKGNVITFLGKVAQAVFEATTVDDYKALSKLRGLPVDALRSWRLGLDGTDWLLPAYSKNGTVHDIRRWNAKTKIMKSTTGCSVQLYGTDHANRVPEGGTIWLCEGEWDCMTMAWMLKLAKCSNAAAVGVPGALVFKDEWREVFRNKDVILCYDNDAAGQAGTLKAYERLLTVTSPIQVIAWPDGTPDKYDIRDFYQDKRKNGLTSPAILTELKKYLQSIDDYMDDRGLSGSVNLSNAPEPVTSGL